MPEMHSDQDRTQGARPLSLLPRICHMVDAIGNFGWPAVPLNHRDAVLSSMQMSENRYSRLQGGQEHSLDRNTAV